MKLKGVLMLALFTFSFVRGNDNKINGLMAGTDPLPFSKLPPQVQSDLLQIMSGTFNEMGGSCLGVEPDYDKVELLLYGNDTKSYIKLNSDNPVGIDNNAPLYIITHGFLSGLNGYKMKEARDKYIEVYGKNILYVNWGDLSWLEYTTCACNVPFIGQFIAKFLCRLSENLHYDLDKVEFIGHSLGAQIAGQTGKGTQKICNKKIGKITALDPAGPLFQFRKPESRLTPDDAKFVQGIHSNAGLFGYTGKVGTVDYHLNCGSVQPGCVIAQDVSKIPETSFFILACAHMRSIELWPYVLDTKRFIGKSCKQCGTGMPFTCKPDLFAATYARMGHQQENFPSDNYNVITGPYSPYTV